MKTEHVCDERCNCPECGSHCHYSPRLDLHACSNVVYCRWKEEPIDMSKIPYHRTNKSMDEWLGIKRARLAELADAPDLKSVSPKESEGSIPSSGTTFFKRLPIHVCEQMPKDPPLILLDKQFINCPYCGEKLG